MAHSERVIFATSYAQRKAITMGLMDMAAFTTSAHELKLHVFDFAVQTSVVYYIYITVIILAMMMQVYVYAYLITRLVNFMHLNIY